MKNFIKNPDRTFEEGLELYKNNFRLNPFEDSKKWLNFFEQKKDSKIGSLEFKMLENRLNYLSQFEKKKEEIVSILEAETKVETTSDPETTTSETETITEQETETITEPVTETITEPVTESVKIIEDPNLKQKKIKGIIS